MKYTFLLSMFFVTFSIVCNSQSLVSYEFLETAEQADISAEYGVAAQTSLEHYKMEYTTTDLNGALDTASGLVTVPVSRDFEFPLLLNLHGTVDGPSDVPSNLAGGYEIAEIISSYQFIGLSPDYLGLGSSRGLHPYVHADSEASATMDMMYAFFELAEELDVHYNEQIFITGYSQGGHAAMAVHRTIELNHIDEFTVTAASHMSGPYSISEKMVDFTLGDDEYFFVAYLASVALTMRNAYPDLAMDYQISDIFKANYLGPIERYANGEIGLFTLNTELIVLLGNDVGLITPKDMLQDDILDALKNDPTHPLSVALADNDVYDWAPLAPTRLMYCKADDQVTFENALLAEQVMNANGAAEVIAINQGDDLNHGGCVNPAIQGTILFFIFKRVVSAYTSTDDILNEKRMSIGQNQKELIIESENTLDENFVILDVLGNKIQTGRIKGKSSTIQKNLQTSGLYILHLEKSQVSFKFFH